MAKVTSKLQVTVPKAIADKYRIRPGDEIDWLPGGDAIRVLPRRRASSKKSVAASLRLFDEATRRQLKRDKGARPSAGDRGWTRDELYDRGRPR